MTTLKEASQVARKHVVELIERGGGVVGVGTGRLGPEHYCLVVFVQEGRPSSVPKAYRVGRSRRKVPVRVVIVGQPALASFCPNPDISCETCRNHGEASRTGQHCVIPGQPRAVPEEPPGRAPTPEELAAIERDARVREATGTYGHGSEPRI